MRKTPGDSLDPLEREIESALDPGEFVHDRACFAFVSKLEHVANGIAAFFPMDPARAVCLYESFLAGCHAKADEVDDSSGNFGMFVQDIIVGWIRARQANGGPAEETVATVLRWMDDDPYSFCSEIEARVASALDDPGRMAFEKQLRVRFEAVADDSASWPYRSLSKALRAVLLSQRDVPAYIEFAERTGLTPEDCLAVSRCVADQGPAGALAWADRGLAIDQAARYRSGVAHDLTKLQRDLLVQVGRGSEALAAAWTDYCNHPCKYTYDDLMKFAPVAERASWRENALEAAARGDLRSRFELLLHLEEEDRMATLVTETSDSDLEDLSHYVTEPFAVKLEEPRPALAARLWRAQAMRILNAKKSKYYDAALRNFERARECLLRAGLPAQWEQTVRQVGGAHFRKTGFMDEFRKMAAGEEPAARLSFLELAKQRWGKSQGHEDETA